MSDRRHTLLWASTLATLLGQALPAQAGGRHGKLGHHTQVVGVGVAGPVMGSAPLSLGVMAAPTTTLGLAPVAVPPQTLGAGYTLVPAATPAAATAPSLGMAYTLVPATATAAPATLGVAPQAYQMVGSSLVPVGTAAGGPTLGAGAGAAAGATPDPEVLLGQALGGGNLQKIKDHLGDVLQDQLAGGQHPRRRALVRLLTDSALEFARDELRVDLVNWLPVVRNLVSQLVDDQVDPTAATTPASDAAPARPAVAPGPKPAAGPTTAPAVGPAPGGRRVIPIQASGYLVIDRIEVQGSIAPAGPATPTPAVEPATDLQPVPSVSPAPAVTPTPATTPTDTPAPQPDQPADPTPVTPTPSQPNLPPADQQPRDDGPLLPGEGNDG